MIQDLAEGDNLIVSELSRLGRSMLECMEILSIATEKARYAEATANGVDMRPLMEDRVPATAEEIGRPAVLAR